MSTPWALVTGASSGIGQALSWELARRGLYVLGVGRRAQALEQTRARDPARIRVVVADIGSPEGREAALEALPDQASLKWLVHNAAVLDPIGPLASVSLSAWRAHMAVNVEAPLFLTQLALERMPAGGRILHLSSGAAHRPYVGWGAYCTAKAALHMLYRCLDQELASRGIRVGSVRPGVVDTPMQARLRATPETLFPARARFIGHYERGELLDPSVVARFLAWLLLVVDAETFAAQEWDIREHGALLPVDF
ncbi:MAG: SDR family NAD(P)-dependent oxidoreductase [Bacteroidetes bacterium]|nr:SDR family NAD(P)-dependent oxidoreductase [Rhodothermia bacterium]MCS7154397.1 SDR family NAD(P)-dependent oxidoreductase [Bacteroidota bacterium]MCX7907642.1 SDR family NAD(P)-dependent oxidoreductase [Bacteroidota bacterium]MDW8137771.1 SDR family NAD(P)-dependent oxidoreductase [Bacteroidota bacterium]MDW8286378.1 SDR family NAD(P)-dependent oxidoreductase [Bacteroidota bacterium]